MNAPPINHQRRVRDGERSFRRRIKRTRVRPIQQRVREGRVRERADDVARLRGDEAEDVRADVVPPERVQVPVRLDGREFGVVVVECGVLSSD